MKEVFMMCPDCGEKLIYCPEIQHSKSKRPLFRCINTICQNSGRASESQYFVLGNKDNYGHTVSDYEIEEDESTLIIKEK